MTEVWVRGLPHRKCTAIQVNVGREKEMLSFSCGKPSALLQEAPLDVCMLFFCLEKGFYLDTYVTPVYKHYL